MESYAREAGADPVRGRIEHVGPVGAVVGEFLGGGKGFGEMVRIAAAQLQTPRVFLLIIYLSLLGLAVFWLVVEIQRRFVFWHKESVTDDNLTQ